MLTKGRESAILALVFMFTPYLKKISYFIVVVLFNSVAVAQKTSEPKVRDFKEAAKAAYIAHGGDKLKTIKTLVIKGSVDVSVQNNVLPGGFSTVISGDKYMLDIQTAFQSIKQTYNGDHTISSLPSMTLPPVTTLGFPLLIKYGDKGYVASALPDGKKGYGFRLTAPDGFFTDFWIDEKTKLIKKYESAYEMNGRTFTTSIEVDKLRIAEGITVPEKYSQRFDLGQITAYANFKAKDILFNSPIDDAVFGKAAK